MKHSLFDNSAVSKMLHHDPFEKRRCHAAIPNAFRIYNKDRTADTDAETGRLSAFDAPWAKQQSLALQERR